MNSPKHRTVVYWICTVGLAAAILLLVAWRTAQYNRGLKDLQVQVEKGVLPLARIELDEVGIRVDALEATISTLETRTELLEKRNEQLMEKIRFTDAAQ